MKPSLTIFISAYNEEKNISSAVKSVQHAFEELILDYEIIIVNDGSTDKTASVIDKIIRSNNNIRFINREKNLGLGLSFLEAVKKAEKNFITAFPGDNDMSGNSLKDLAKNMLQADLVTAYMENPKHRMLFRRVISGLYVSVMNLLFELKLKYYNGPFICKTSLIKNMPIISSGHTVYAEIKVRLIKNGASFMEIPFEHIGRIHDRSKAVSWRNINSTIKMIFLLYREIHK